MWRFSWVYCIAIFYNLFNLVVVYHKGTQANNKPRHSSQMFWGAGVAAIDRNRIVTVVALPGVLLIEIDPP